MASSGKITKAIKGLFFHADSNRASFIKQRFSSIDCALDHCNGIASP